MYVNKDLESKLKMLREWVEEKEEGCNRRSLQRENRKRRWKSRRSRGRVRGKKR